LHRVLFEEGLLEEPLSFLDVGAGDAFFARELSEATHPGSHIVCWDNAYTETNHPPLANGEVGRLSYCTTQPKEQFDMILLLDVLEHIADDEPFLRDVVVANLKLGGHVLISVPAWMFLFGRHDRNLRHYRRYAPHNVRSIIARTGLQLVRGGGLFHSLLILRLIQRAKERVAAGRPEEGGTASERRIDTGIGHWGRRSVTTKLIDTFLEADNWVSLQLSRFGLEAPGLSWWALCRTRQS
jgi:SAM-dependent methyltransferase